MDDDLSKIETGTNPARDINSDAVVSKKPFSEKEAINRINEIQNKILEDFPGEAVELLSKDKYDPISKKFFENKSTERIIIMRTPFNDTNDFNLYKFLIFGPFGPRVLEVRDNNFYSSSYSDVRSIKGLIEITRKKTSSEENLKLSPDCSFSGLSYMKYNGIETLFLHIRDNSYLSSRGMEPLGIAINNDPNKPWSSTRNLRKPSAEEINVLLDFAKKQIPIEPTLSFVPDEEDLKTLEELGF